MMGLYRSRAVRILPGSWVEERRTHIVILLLNIYYIIIYRAITLLLLK